MMNIIITLIISLIISFLILYIASQLFKVPLQIYSSRFLLYWIIESFYLTFAYFITDNFIRVICNYLVFSIIDCLYFKKRLIGCSFVSFITLLLFFIAESLCALGILLFVGKEHNLHEFFLNFTANMLIAIMMYIFIKIPIFKTLLIEKLEKIDDNKNTIFLFLLFSILSLSILMYSIFFQLNMMFSVLLILIVTIIYFGIILALMNEKTHNMQLQMNYNIKIKELNNFEKRLDKQTKKNHDNSNHLSAIRGMIDPNNKEAIEYIDSLSSGIRKENKTISEKIKDIPYGNLRELIYQKALLMEEKKYNYSLEVSKEIKKLNKINTKMIKDVCTIIGILLDNSIQAVQGYKKKQVGIYFYKENNYLIIKVSNNFKGNLEIEKFDEKGYTSKGKDHGYGLNIVKEILDKNDNIVNEKIFNGDIFSQVIKIKIK